MVLSLLLAFFIQTCQPNNITDYSTLRAMQESYYEKSPKEFCGFATRYGRDSRAIDELYWEATEVVAQHEHGYILLGGNYGYQVIDGVEYLLDNRASMGYSKHITNQDYQHLTPAQRRLLMLGNMDRETFNDYIVQNYIGVVSIKSPNDIGREFCLYDVYKPYPIGTVIVGGTAASKDWLLVGSRANYETIGLGLMKSIDSQGNGWYWAVDLPNSLYYGLSHNGEHPHVRFVDGRCTKRQPEYFSRK